MTGLAYTQMKVDFSECKFSYSVRHTVKFSCSEVVVVGDGAIHILARSIALYTKAAST